MSAGFLDGTHPAAGSVGDAAQPIVVADAHRGTGVMMCPGKTRLLKVADGYHGVGIAVCIPERP